jgi:FkbM family methyltransferase
MSSSFQPGSDIEPAGQSSTADAENPFLAMQRLISDVPNPIIFDVGAFDGHISLVFRKLFPTSSIYAFEPFAGSFKQLWLNTVNDPNIHLFNFGLSNQVGTLPFHSNQRPETNSLLPTDPVGSNTWAPGILETQNVVRSEFRTIDSVMAEMNIPKIHILKLDVQGAEPLVIEGASSACELGLIDLIYSEIITQPTYADQRRFDEALAVFYNAGFDLYRIYNPSFTDKGRLRQVDAIFTQTSK